MSRIVLDGVSKQFSDGTTAVDALDLEVADGELLVLVGPSGCGKTTALRMVAGLEEVSSGTIYIDGNPVNDMEPRHRDVAMVFQSYALYPHLSVYDNMAFSLKYRKVPKAEVRRRVDEAARILELEPYLERKPRQLSGGQRQRVAMGRAIVRQPRAFLMDEPLSNLDAQLRQEMRQEIRNLQRALGITMVYVTHDQVEAMTMADRVILLSGGKIVQNGTPADLYEAPANTFVARFIGTPPMSLLTLASGQGGAVIAGTPGPAVAPEELAGATLGVRPEHVALDRDGVAARIEGVEYLGADSLLQCRVGEQSLWARVSGRVGLSRGDTASLSWARGAQHFFDGTTGARIESEPVRRDATMFA